MKFTTRQAADRLGVGIGTIAAWVRKGKLKDVSGKTTKRHEILLDSKEVIELAKTFRNRLRARQRPVADSPFQPAGILTRLDRIERMLDEVRAVTATLLQIWS